MDHSSSDQRRDDAAALGALIARERRRRGLSRGELAKLCRQAGRPGCRINDRRIESWEHGLSYPQPVNLRALAGGLEMPVEQLSGKIAPEGQDTHRREFLFALAAGSAGLIDVERLAAPTVDAAWLQDAEMVSMALAEQRSKVAPASLAPAALGHLSALEARLPATSELTAGTAYLVGSLLGRSGRLAPAYRAYALAESLGDNVLRGKAMNGRAGVFERQGEAGKALPLEEAAVSMLRGAPGRARAGVLARRAELRAMHGDETGAMLDLDAAETAIADGAYRWYYLNPEFDHELGAYRGSVLALLGRYREAIDAYTWTLDRMDPALLDWRGKIAADRNAALSAS